MIYDAKESALANGRDFTVDSKEIFELMVDGDIEAIQNLSGYGVLTWYVPGAEHIGMVRLSDHSDICVVGLQAGGVAWASTWSILRDALEFAEIEAECEYAVPDIGRVYQFRDNGVYRTPVTGIKFDPPVVSDTPEDWEVKLMKAWAAEDEAKKEYEELLMGLEEESRADFPPMDYALRTSWEKDEEEYEYPSIAGTYK